MFPKGSAEHKEHEHMVRMAMHYDLKHKLDRAEKVNNFTNPYPKGSHEHKEHENMLRTAMHADLKRKHNSHKSNEACCGIMKHGGKRHFF